MAAGGVDVDLGGVVIRPVGHPADDGVVLAGHASRGAADARGIPNGLQAHRSAGGAGKRRRCGERAILQHILPADGHRSVVLRKVRSLRKVHLESLDMIRDVGRGVLIEGGNARHGWIEDGIAFDCCAFARAGTGVRHIHRFVDIAEKRGLFQPSAGAHRNLGSRATAGGGQRRVELLDVGTGDDEVVR